MRLGIIRLFSVITMIIFWEIAFLLGFQESGMCAMEGHG